MSQRFKEIIIPPLAGLLVALLVSIGIQTLLIEYYYPKDFDEAFSPYFFIDIYFMAFLPILLVAILFQLFIASGIWKRYGQNKTILNLSLAQLILISCFFFGTATALYRWQTFYGIEAFVVMFLRVTVVSILYWTVTLYTLKSISPKREAIQLPF